MISTDQYFLVEKTKTPPYKEGYVMSTKNILLGMMMLMMMMMMILMMMMMMIWCFMSLSKVRGLDTIGSFPSFFTSYDFLFVIHTNPLLKRGLL